MLCLWNRKRQTHETIEDNLLPSRSGGGNDKSLGVVPGQSVAVNGDTTADKGHRHFLIV